MRDASKSEICRSKLKMSLLHWPNSSPIFQTQADGNVYRDCNLASKLGLIMNNCNDDPARNRVKITLCKQKTIHLVKKNMVPSFKPPQGPINKILPVIRQRPQSHRGHCVAGAKLATSPSRPLGARGPPDDHARHIHPPYHGGSA